MIIEDDFSPHGFVLNKNHCWTTCIRPKLVLKVLHGSTILSTNPQHLLKHLAWKLSLVYSTLYNSLAEQ